MKKYVLGIDIGTGSVKVTGVDYYGKIVAQESASYPLLHPQVGFSEQNPDDWVKATTKAIHNLLALDKISAAEIAGISYSGQMHGLVLLNKNNEVLRPAILWDDTRTTKQCQLIEQQMAQHFIQITHNRPLEGFTLPKILWVQENEPEIWQQVKIFLLPKDYVRYQMTGQLATDYSDATGSVMLDINTQQWSSTICDQFHIPLSICPSLLHSSEIAGTISSEYAQISGLQSGTPVYAGAADNAASAVGAGLLQPQSVLSSIGTSGVVLKYEPDAQTNYQGVLQFEDHALNDAYYSMGVTLAAGDSLNWFQRTFCRHQSFAALLKEAEQSPVGANGLVFTPYLVGERAPYADAFIRGSFIGLDSSHKRADFIRSILEGIIFSFEDLMQIYQHNQHNFDTVISIGGGAQSPLWLQIQADIFNKKVASLMNEQTASLGATIIAAVGAGWYANFQDCTDVFVKTKKFYYPIADNVTKYQKLYPIYHQVYQHTRDLSFNLIQFRQQNH